MVEELRRGIFRMEIPFPGSPLKAVNSYLVRGDDRSLLVDAGIDGLESLKAMEIGLRDLRVSTERLDFFITHSHLDHIGLCQSSSRKAPESILASVTGKPFKPKIGGLSWLAPFFPMVSPSRICGGLWRRFLIGGRLKCLL